MPSLAFPYSKSSTLPKRDWLVSVSVTSTTGTDVTETFDVVAPDCLQAEALVRRILWSADWVAAFSIEMVREVVTVWDSETGRYALPLVIIPDAWSHTITINHR